MGYWKGVCVVGYWEGVCSGILGRGVCNGESFGRRVCVMILTAPASTQNLRNVIELNCQAMVQVSAYYSLTPTDGL